MLFRAAGLGLGLGGLSGFYGHAILSGGSGETACFRVLRRPAGLARRARQAPWMGGRG
ncbi:hypothetical protein RR42_m1298 [Cupriavidus basilensis]|uniref:Uncharacterized protein n=1 Tax=Cupriavidus basilensis TaxID=68895 RepID=A0A0C4Y936_9BURK|nr:hypothetical protein RR42_m1298 [Cupriavidus basilensis]